MSVLAGSEMNFNNDNHVIIEIYTVLVKRYVPFLVHVRSKGVKLQYDGQMRGQIIFLHNKALFFERFAEKK